MQPEFHSGAVTEFLYTEKVYGHWSPIQLNGKCNYLYGSDFEWSDYGRCKDIPQTVAAGAGGAAIFSLNSPSGGFLTHALIPSACCRRQLGRRS